MLKKYKYTIIASILYILFAGLLLPLESFISPKHGIGFALGIIGACMMLTLFTYSARKRFEFMRKLSPLKNWMNLHIFLGIFGPICIFYHSRFSLGATNSNVALFSMLTVAVSGVIGRYLYNRVSQRLFRLWHYAHVPFVWTLVISSIVHIISSVWIY